MNLGHCIQQEISPGMHEPVRNTWEATYIFEIGNELEL
jgi:hypothetical protein